MFPFERRENIHGARTRGNAARRRGNVQHPTGILAPDTEKHFDRNATLHISSWLRIPLRVSPSLSRRSLLSCVRREARLKGPRSVLKTRDICDIHPMLPTGTYVLLVYPRAGRGYEADFYTCSPTLHRGE